MLYFCKRLSNLVRKDELEQKQRVVAFKEKITGQALFKEYESLEEFRSTLREDLTKYLLTFKPRVVSLFCVEIRNNNSHHKFLDSPDMIS